MQRILLWMMLLSLTGTAFSRQISPNEAETIASEFLNTTATNVASTKRIGVNRVKEANGNDNSHRPFYIFNSDEGKGFVIVAGDDCVKTILGYSRESNFNYDDISPAFLWLLESYKKEICSLSETTKRLMADDNSTDNPALKPLLTTEWGQEEPFNGLCPEYEGMKLPTGCVATAVAQIINYHQWPNKGEGNFSYQWADQTLTFDYENTPFDWNLMLDRYAQSSPNESCTEVAKLMYACGVGLEMYYTLSGSGSDISRAKRYLVENMKYDPEAKIIWRHNYSYRDWTETIYEEIKAGRPVFLAGGDHAFICDGYDGEGCYHFNWGWNGDMDGYFVFNDLSPLGYSFSSNLHALVNLHKREGEATPLSYDIYSAGSFKLENDALVYEKIYNYSRYDYQGTIGVEVVGKNSGERFFNAMTDFSIEGSMPYGLGTFFTSTNWEISKDLIDLPIGIYELYPAYSTYNGSYARIKCLAGGQSFINLVVDEDRQHIFTNPGNEAVTNMEVSEISFVGEDVSTTEYYMTGENNFSVYYTVFNHSENAMPDRAVVISDETGNLILQHPSSLILEPNSENPIRLDFVSVLLRPGPHLIKFLSSDGEIIGEQYKFTVIGTSPEVEIEEITNLYINPSNNETTYVMSLNMLPNSLTNLKGAIELFRDGFSTRDDDITFYPSDQAGILSAYFNQPFDSPLYGEYEANVYDNYGVKLNISPLNVSINIPNYVIDIELPWDYKDRMDISDTIQLTVLISDADYYYNCPFEWSSSNPGVATVSNTGVVEALSYGTTTITVKALDGTEKSASVEITVAPTPVESILLNPESMTVNVGETFHIEAIVFPENSSDKSVTWTSSDSSIAKVDAQGNVTAFMAGNATITATSSNGITANCEITILPKLVETLTIDPTIWNGVEGSEFRVTATVLPENATDKTLVWSSSDESVATVDAEGYVKVVKSGNCVITAATMDGSGLTAECLILVTSGVDAIFVDEALVDVYDINGALVKKESNREGLRGLAPGIYVLRSGNVTVKAIVKD